MAELPKDQVHALLARWAGGEDDALNEIFPHYFFKVVGILKQQGILIEDAKDLVQQVFINLHETLRGGGKPPAKLTYYLVTAARRIVSYRNRYKKNNLPIAEVDVHDEWSHQLPSSVRTLASTMGSIEIRNILREAIERLPDQQRQVYLLRLEGLKEHEIAKKMGLAVGTVKHYVHLGLERLKQELDDIARKMSTWYAQRQRGELTPVAILQATQKIAKCYGDPVRLKFFERVSDEDGAKKLNVDVDVYRARLASAYELLEAELGVTFPDGFDVLNDGNGSSNGSTDD